MSGRSESNILSQKIDTLRSQEISLRENSDNLLVLVKQLQADISGLESQRRNKQQAIELMTQDISEFNSLSLRFDTIASRYETAHQNVQDSINSINIFIKLIFYIFVIKNITSSNNRDIPSGLPVIPQWS